MLNLHYKRKHRLLCVYSACGGSSGGGFGACACFAPVGHICSLALSFLHVCTCVCVLSFWHALLVFVHARVPPKFKLSFYYFSALSLPLSHTLSQTNWPCACVCVALWVTLSLSLLFLRSQRKFCAFVIVSLFRTAFVVVDVFGLSLPLPLPACLSVCLVASVAASTSSSSSCCCCWLGGARWLVRWAWVELFFFCFCCCCCCCLFVASSSVSERDSLKKYATEKKKRLSDPAN